VLIKQTDVARNEASSIGVDYTGATLFSGSYDPGLPFAAGSTYAVGTAPSTASTARNASAINYEPLSISVRTTAPTNGDALAGNSAPGRSDASTAY